MQKKILLVHLTLREIRATALVTSIYFYILSHHELTAFTVRIDSRSGKKIKMKIEKDAADIAMELGRAEMRAFFNSQF